MKNTNKILSFILAVTSTVTISFTALAADNMQNQSVGATKSPSTARTCIKAPTTSAKQINAGRAYTPQIGGCGKFPDPASNPNPKKLCFAGLCIKTGN